MHLFSKVIKESSRNHWLSWRKVPVTAGGLLDSFWSRYRKRSWTWQTIAM